MLSRFLKTKAQRLFVTVLNCLHAENSYRGRSLSTPAFDIHYNARAEGHDHSKSQELKYALVISVKARRIVDLYDRIVRRYRGQLEALLPVIEIPIRLDNDDTESQDR